MVKKTFEDLRNSILINFKDNKKTINQIASETGINWKTVERHLTYLMGKKLVNEVFNSPYVRIFALSEIGIEQVKKLGEKNE